VVLVSASIEEGRRRGKTKREDEEGRRGMKKGKYECFMQQLIQILIQHPLSIAVVVNSAHPCTELSILSAYEAERGDQRMRGF
jgi:hypothetical protein